MGVHKGVPLRCVLLAVLLLFPLCAWATVETFTTPGDATWTAPAGVTSIQVECWGGGAAGSRANATNNTGRGGGGGGGYGKRNAMTVTPGNNYSYHVGAGGTDSSTPVNGENSTFTGDASVQCIGTGATSVADNTTNGTAGATGSTGDVTHDGGSGANGSGSNSGGGGEGAGTTATGGNASGTTGGSGTDGGNGGSGQTCASGGGTAGNPGTAPGGGGGGGCRGNAVRNGGAGAAGQIKLTYTAAAGNNFPRVQ